ncbi:MAG TPA: alpha-L-fucosidase [Candidatus Binataceae bacterium]|nr:alpha-L-fucosidase [Candidatus Binataceae bacterium]
MSWFDTARFGMFIHWGIASVAGLELSWPLVGGLGALPQGTGVTISDYYAAAPRFNPTQLNAREIARLARRAGMQYAVLTAKHHDGFALFRSRAEGAFSIESISFPRDIVREFTDAFRAEGLHVGLYFSLCDWHHPDYPAFAEDDKPYRWGAWRRSSADAWQRYLHFMFTQIRELLTNYGSIDLIWFDGGWERTVEEWRARDLVEMIRSLQPNILINDRLPGFGDYETPEQAVPAHPPDRIWETCMTMNDSWGYNPSDSNYKSAIAIAHTLAEVAGKRGNLLLNVSPRADGSLPPEQIVRLDEIAGWMQRGAKPAIIDTTSGLEPWQFYGPSTRNGQCIYVHLLMKPYETVSIRGVQVRRVKSIRAVTAGGRELKFRKRITAADMLFNHDPMGTIEIEIPESAVDPVATVISVEIAPAPLPESGERFA